MLRNTATTLSSSIPSLLVAVIAISAASLFSSIEFKFAGARIRPFEGLMLICLSWAFFSKGTALWRDVGPLKAVLGFFLGAYAIRAMSAVFIESAFVGLVEVLQAVEFTIFALLVGVACARPSGRMLFLWVFGSCSLGIGLVALALGLTEGQIAGLKRFDEPKYTYGIVCLFVAVSYVLSMRHRLLWGIVLAMIAPLVILSGERNAWLGITAALLFLAAIGGSAIKGRLRQILLSAAIGGTIFATSFWFVAQFNEYAARQWTRLAEPLSYWSTWSGGFDYLAAESPSNRARLLQMQNLVEVVQEYPWFGLGTGQYYPYASAVAFSSDLSYITTMHGEYWQLLVENGVLAFALYCAAWAAFFWAGLKMVSGITSEQHAALSMALAVGVYGAVANMFVGGGAVNFLLFFLPIGLCLGVWREISAKTGGMNPERAARIENRGTTRMMHRSRNRPGRQ